MNGLNPMYETVTRHQHEQDIRHAAEFRMIRDARRRTGATGVIARFLARFTGAGATIVETTRERDARTAV